MTRFEPGKTLGPYEIIAPLGAGGMGEVYRARDPRLGREVAIKMLPQSLAADPELRARFEREARTLSQLNHPHICTLFDVGHDDGVDYLVLELIDGETLASRLSRGAMPVEQLLKFAAQIAGALAEAHRAGLVHRDLKPGNLMLTQSSVKLLDFGLARPAAPLANTETPSQSQTVMQPLTGVGALVGTLQYMAPEQLAGGEADARSDVFAVGRVLLEMATGRRPSQGSDKSTPSDFNLPRGLERILARCLENDPAQRYPSAVELGEDLERLQCWVAEEALPELARICDRIMIMEEGRDSWAAYELACEIDKLSPREAMLDQLRPDFSLPISIESDPPGAKVSACFYSEPDGEWVSFGTTPLHDIAYPRGLTRVRIELAGRIPAHDIVHSLTEGLTNATHPSTNTWRYRLHEEGEVPAEMVAVPAGGAAMYMPGLDHLEVEPTADFLLDRHPVTNREYKCFVDDGGYTRREFWREAFEDEGRVLEWDEASARLTDAVGSAGPATWEMGDYAHGEDEHPVAGISWFEACAYAAWAGKSLPTIFHWNRVAFTFSCAQIAPLANLAGRATVPVGHTKSINRFGVHDLAGNVREWVVNGVSNGGARYILGGGWNDPGYAFADAYAQPPFDRSRTNGFRCMRALAAEPNESALTRAIAVPFIDFRSEKPVSDDVFQFFLGQFRYDAAPLKAIVTADRPSPLGRWQSIEIAAAYGGERMPMHLFLPARSKPPYQTVVLFPGSLALHTRIFSDYEIRRVDFLIKSGRAVLLPVYKSTYERGDELSSDYPRATAFYKDHVINWGKDLSRAIDYIESREDLDSGSIAYYGTSWGGALGAILPAVEKRIKVNVLYVAGLSFQRSLPEVDQLNYVPHVTQPTLMLNGELDFFFPAETSQRPMFDLLGTPAEQKKRLTYARGHTVPKVELIRESLAWLDRWCGPVS